MKIKMSIEKTDLESIVRSHFNDLMPLVQINSIRFVSYANCIEIEGEYQLQTSLDPNFSDEDDYGFNSDDKDDHTQAPDTEEGQGPQ